MSNATNKESESCAADLQEMEIIPVAFHQDGKTVGCIRFDDGKLTFTGDLDASARIFAGELAKMFDEINGKAQARIAELEAALEHIAGAVPSFDYVEAINGKPTDWTTPGSPYDRGKAEAYRVLNEFARRALEAKP